MLILDSVIEANNNSITIPFYHRGPLSLKTGTTVSLCLIPKQDESFSARATEMIVSPINFEWWANSIRITGTFFDKPGIVNKLLAIVAEQNLNIVTGESSSMQNRDLHQIELIAYFPKPKLGSLLEENERLVALERRIIAFFSREELHMRSGIPQLKVKRMMGLYTAYQKYMDATSNQQKSARPLLATGKFQGHGKLIVPSSFMDILGRIDLRYQLVSDTKERSLSVFFPSNEEYFTYVRISHIDSVGVLELITRQLAKAFNIINSLTRIQSQGRTNEFEVLLFSLQYSKKEDEETRRRIINSLLSQEELNAYDLQISFPENVASATRDAVAPQNHSQMDFKPIAGKAEIAQKELESSTMDLIKRQLSNLERDANTSDFSIREDCKQRIEFFNRMAKHEDIHSHAPVPRIFISCNFGKSSLFDIAGEIIRKAGAIPLTGKDPNQGSIYRDEIIRRINQSDSFLGIWTIGKGKITPWLLWELGVAQSSQKPFRILCGEGVQLGDLTRINPEKQYFKFEEVDFREKCSAAIEILMDDLKNARGRDWRS